MESRPQRNVVLEPRRDHTCCAVHRRLEEFFIGGSLELEDMSSVGIPSTFRGTFLSKFGFKTESSGTVRVRVNMAVQQKRKADKRQMRLQQVSVVKGWRVRVGRVHARCI